MDEHLINASLRQREPASLPWSTDTKEKNNDDKPVAKTTTSVVEGINSNIEDERSKLRAPDEIFERKSSTESRYGYFDSKYNLQNEKRSNALKKSDLSSVESENKSRGLTYGTSGLSIKDATRSFSGYRRKIPMLNTTNNVKEKHGANLAASCLSECHTNIYIERTKSPRSSSKVSRKMFQETSSSSPVHLPFGIILSESKYKMSNGAGSPLKNGDDFANKQIEQRRVINSLERESCLSKSLGGTILAAKVNLKRKNDGTIYKKSNKFNGLDIDVDNELDDLLEITTDAISHESKRNVEREKLTNVIENSTLAQSEGESNPRRDNGTVSSKDFKVQDRSVSRNLSSEQKQDNTKVLVMNDENVRGSDSTSLKKVDETKIGEDVNLYEDSSSQRRIYESVQSKELSRRKEIREIRNNMDVIDGLGVETFDKKAQETKKCKAKNSTRETGNEKKNGGAVLETNSITSKERRVRRKGRKDVRVKENTSRDSALMSRQSETRAPNKKDTEDDVYDISPVKNRESLSDSEDDSDNGRGKYKGLRSNLLKRDEGRKMNKSGEVEEKKITKAYSVDNGWNTEVTPRQTQIITTKKKHKRSKRENIKDLRKINKVNNIEQVDEQPSNKQQKRKGSNKVVKTSVNDSFPKDGTTRTNGSGNNELKRAPVETRHTRPKPETGNLLVQGTDKNVHEVRDDQKDYSKTGHKLKSSKSYTIIKHDRTTKTRTDKREDKARFIHKDRRGQCNFISCEPVSRVHVREGIEKNITVEVQLKVNERHYEKVSVNTQKNINVEVKNTSLVETEKISKQEHIDNFPDVELGDLMYDSDTDTDKISDIQYQSYLLDKPPSDTSSDFEFPRPASNRTFIIDSESEGEEGCVTIHEVTKKKEKQISRAQRMVNFFMCCFIPKTKD